MSMEQSKEGNKEQVGQIQLESQALVKLSWGQIRFGEQGVRAFID